MQKHLTDAVELQLASVMVAAMDRIFGPTVVPTVDLGTSHFTAEELYAHKAAYLAFYEGDV